MTLLIIMPISPWKPSQMLMMMRLTVKVNHSLVKIWLWSLKFKTFTLFRKGEYIIMVKNVIVTAFDGKKLKDLIQTVFREKEN